VKAQPVASADPDEQLAGFLAKFAPDVASHARAALERMQTLLPNAFRLVYDNYRGLVIGFSPTERPSDALFSIAIYPGRVNLCFLQDAPALKDPYKLLLGSGNVARHLVLENADALEEPRVKALMGQALQRGRVPFDTSLPSKLIIRSISAKQLPRRP